ncbi:MAG: hypothetical protein GKR95_03000 [Gammaproteobacteria bacterium]|nr:hypothetical protein [Gammaproteobacteria bacterium]
MKLVSYNIQYGKGQDNIVDIERIVGEIQGADVIALQEVDRFWPRTGMVDQVQQITERLPEYYWVYGAGVDLHCSQSPPHENRRRQFGNMILSRYPIESSRHHLLPKLGSIGPLSIQRSAIEASIKPCSYKLRIYSVHLTHLSSQTRARSGLYLTNRKGGDGISTRNNRWEPFRTDRAVVSILSRRGQP